VTGAVPADPRRPREARRVKANAAAVESTLKSLKKKAAAKETPPKSSSKKFDEDRSGLSNSRIPSIRK